MKFNFKGLLQEIENKEIEIGHNNGKLIFEIPEEYYNDDLVVALKKYKVKLLNHFHPIWNRKNIMLLNHRGSKIPFFLIHGDNAHYFLKDSLGEDRPFYGFLHLGSDGLKIPFTDLRKMAYAYVEQLLEIKSNGPYILGGFSLGGLLAYEVAIILQEMGHEVPKLILFDCKNPSIKEKPCSKPSVLKRFVKKNLFKSLKVRTKIQIDNLTFKLCLLLNKPIPLKKRTKYIWKVYFEIMDAYNHETKKYNGDILLFKVDSNPSKYNYLGWDEICDSVKMIMVTGTHINFLNIKENIDVIRKGVSEFIDD